MKKLFDVSGIQLARDGRVELSDEQLVAIERETDFTIAGAGTGNASCSGTSNAECTNVACDGTGNYACANGACDQAMNVSCSALKTYTV